MSNRFSRRGLAAAAMLPAAAILPAAFARKAEAAGAESTFDRIRRTKVMRVAGLNGELPWFSKDIATGKWSGAAADMATDIASVFDAKIVYVEATYGSSILDLQSNKVDIGFALNPTPQRALSVTFTEPTIIHPFGCIAKKGFAPKTWADLDKPDIRIAVDSGSLHEVVAKRFAPRARIIAFPNRDAAILALQSGHADVDILAALLGLTAIAKNPSLGPYHLLTPIVALPSSIAIQREPDTRFRDVLNAWIEFNRGIGTIREWLINGLVLEGVKRSQIPPELTF